MRKQSRSEMVRLYFEAVSADRSDNLDRKKSKNSLFVCRLGAVTCVGRVFYLFRKSGQLFSSPCLGVEYPLDRGAQLSVPGMARMFENKYDIVKHVAFLVRVRHFLTML